MSFSARTSALVTTMTGLSVSSAVALFPSFASDLYFLLRCSTTKQSISLFVNISF